MSYDNRLLSHKERPCRMITKPSLQDVNKMKTGKDVYVFRNKSKKGDDEK